VKNPAGLETFRAVVGNAASVVLTTHINPDGDALGSELSLARFLVDGGKTVRIVNRDPAPENLRFLENDEIPFEIYDPTLHDELIRSSDLVLLVDNAAPDRLGSMEPLMREVANRTLCIDHHPSRGAPWVHHILDERACATSVMIFDLTRACGWTADARSAEAMYVGLVTDTGFFRFNSTTVRAHEVAAQLLALGARSAPIYEAIYEHNSLAYTRLLGHALVGLVFAADGAIATVTLPAALIHDLGAEDVDTAEIATTLLAMDGVTIALLFRESPERRVKVSLRSKGGIDVHRLAGEFGGGGHRNASGIVMDGRLDDVVRSVLERTAGLLAGS